MSQSKVPPDAQIVLDSLCAAFGHFSQVTNETIGAAIMGRASAAAAPYAADRVEALISDCAWVVASYWARDDHSVATCRAGIVDGYRAAYKRTGTPHAPEL
jgi:hypothetical protein